MTEGTLQTKNLYLLTIVANKEMKRLTIIFSKSL